MTSPLTTLRKNRPRITAHQFLAANPGCWIRYEDDTPAWDPAKALEARRFERHIARRKQGGMCGVWFSVQPFLKRRTPDHVLCYRTLAVEVDLVAPGDGAGLVGDANNRLKEEYLQRVILPFRLAPHWLIETRRGFQVLFRVQPQRKPCSTAEMSLFQHRLAQALRGTPDAAIATQILRVPGTLEFTVPDRPFYCRLLVDLAPAIHPYPLAAVHRALDAWERDPARTGEEGEQRGDDAPAAGHAAPIV